MKMQDASVGTVIEHLENDPRLRGMVGTNGMFFQKRLPGPWEDEWRGIRGWRNTDTDGLIRYLRDAHAVKRISGETVAEAIKVVAQRSRNREDGLDDGRAPARGAPLRLRLRGLAQELGSVGALLNAIAVEFDLENEADVELRAALDARNIATPDASDPF